VAMQQIHSTYIHSVRESDLGRGSRLWSTAIPSCDGLVTDQKGPVLMAFGADCPLIIAADEERGVIGIAHSGWKGTIKGIAKELIFKMTKDFDGDVRHINVGITASARECCYEVDHDLAERFRAEGYSDSVHCRDSSSYINLHDTIRSQLLGEGVCDDKINSMTDCTICGNQFFSFRKEKEQSGRFCGLIWLKQ
jgi:polyphenol oxidase